MHYIVLVQKINCEVRLDIQVHVVSVKGLNNLPFIDCMIDVCFNPLATGIDFSS